jgi:hypothetical protein
MEIQNHFIGAKTSKFLIRGQNKNLLIYQINKNTNNTFKCGYTTASIKRKII